MTDYDAERLDLHEALQAVLAEHEGGPYLMGWHITFEVSAATGERWLMHRSGDANGKQLLSWQALGYLRSSLLDIEDQNREGRFHPDDEDE